MAKKSNDSRSRVIAAERAREAKRPLVVERTSPAKRGLLTTIFKTYRGNSFAAQRERLMAALRAGPATTHEIRTYLDVQAVGARIWELRHRFDHNIETVTVRQKTTAGELHKFAMYMLKRKA